MRKEELELLQKLYMVSQKKRAKATKKRGVGAAASYSCRCVINIQYNLSDCPCHLLKAITLYFRASHIVPLIFLEL